MPRKQGVRCKICNYVIKRVGDDGWAHKSKTHWVDKPHKAAPATVRPHEDSHATNDAA